MVGRLEKLGFVTRFGSRIDRRTKQVALTRTGLALLRQALDKILEGEVVERAYQRALCVWPSADLEPFADLEPSEELQLAIAELVERVQKIAKAFGDTSRLRYDSAWGWPA
jgi:DNA-binding MarR family transcriptional regulator